MTLAAFDLSEKYQVPVILRMTTRINHVKALVTVGERQEYVGAGFKKDPSRFVMVPGNAGKRIPLMFQRDNTLRAEAEQSAWNVIEPGSDRRVAFITSGPAYMHVKESFPDAPVLKLGFSWPVPFDKCRELAALGFVAIFLVPVLIFAARPKAMTRTAAWLRRHGARTPARGLRILGRGLALCRHWFTAADAALALLLGLLAWGVTALSFVWLLHRLGVTELNFASALSAYPLAMLAGAASMLPGGLGSTEAAIALLLGWHGVPVATATLAAVGIRLATLWFAIACGLLAVSWLEWRGPR